jgi:diadenosine tetraphosphate (Ap4A) HIT family hydrolase
MYDVNNIFAKIIQGQIPCKEIYQDQDVISFYDINPQAPVHALVLPKKAYTDYTDFMTKAESLEVVNFFSKLNHVIKLLDLKSFRIITNQGEISGQSIFHFHVHILSGIEMNNLI